MLTVIVKSGLSNPPKTINKMQIFVLYKVRRAHLRHSVKLQIVQWEVLQNDKCAEIRRLIVTPLTKLLIT